MKKVAKNCEKLKDVFIDFSKCKQIMSSNLPLLFANGRPRSLDTISQSELEEFVPFMILCSLGHNQLMKPKEINNCPVPEWWPKGFPFKYPLVDQSNWRNRQVMLLSLVCRCYTFYDCEFLLKFSSELEEMSSSQLKYKENRGDNTTTIYDAAENVLVKCRNENLNYDMHKNRRRYLSPTHRPSMSPPFGKKCEPVIDLTFDSSSEDEKEVSFKRVQAAANKSKKRKPSTDLSREPKQRCVRRVFNDFPKEQREPQEYSQEQFMAKFQLIPKGKEITKEEVKLDRKKRLAHRFQLLPVTSERGQRLLMQNKHTCNIESLLERVNKYCGPIQELGQETGQVATRSSHATHVLYQDEPDVEEDLSESHMKWSHQYKWPHRTRNVKYPHRGPCIKPCTVRIVALTDDVIDAWTKKRCTVSTMTPELWRLNLPPFCACQKIPLIELDEESQEKYKTRGSSTRCICMPKLQNMAQIQMRRSMPESHSPNYNADSSGLYSGVPLPPPPTTLYPRPRPRPRPPLTYYSGGHSISSVLHDTARYHAEPTLHGKLAPHHARRPLAVVPHASVFIEKKDPDMLCQLMAHAPLQTTLSSVKINFERSILEAVMWYSHPSAWHSHPSAWHSHPSAILVVEPLLKEDLLNVRSSQENIKPLSQALLPDYKNLIDYFRKGIDPTKRDYCYAKTGDCSILVTQRGAKRYPNREPCPSCFQGRDNFCVYEFVRQAKLAGLNLHRSYKQLQQIFIKLIQAITVNIN